VGTQQQERVESLKHDAEEWRLIAGEEARTSCDVSSDVIHELYVMDQYFLAKVLYHINKTGISEERNHWCSLRLEVCLQYFCYTRIRMKYDSATER
jgi:hypothetical protein